MSKENEFLLELKSLLNRFSKENVSDTPDFILASYIEHCLQAYNNATNAREKFYGRNLKVRAVTDITDGIETLNGMNKSSSDLKAKPLAPPPPPAPLQRMIREGDKVLKTEEVLKEIANEITKIRENRTPIEPPPINYI